MRCGVVVFPGSNCDHDVYHVWKHVLQQEATFLWHQDETLRGCDLVVLPGGFAYGDYLRAGALAALSPVMAAVQRHAAAGGLVLGICNGFQVLLEAGLLPGAMRRNASLRFECRNVWLRVERDDLPFTRGLAAGPGGRPLRMPIAHAEGNYEDSPERLDALEAARLVAFRYVSPAGELDPAWNFNGAARAIAGVCNAAGNVLGLMPHPERCAEEILGSTDGLAIFASALRWWEGGGRGAAAGPGVRAGAGEARRGAAAADRVAGAGEAAAATGENVRGAGRSKVEGGRSVVGADRSGVGPDRSVVGADR